jgi:hypothetical protein
MFRAFSKRGWRGAVGLIAAYVLVLQASLAYGIAAQAAAHGNGSGSFFVICVNDDSSAATDGAAAPGRPTTHCPICTLTTAAVGIAPDPVALPLPQSVSAHRTSFVTTEACVSYHRARAGLTRAPPQNV